LFRDNEKAFQPSWNLLKRPDITVLVLRAVSPLVDRPLDVVAATPLVARFNQFERI